MLRIYVCGAVAWVLSAAGLVQPVFAEGKNVRCDGGVVVKAGRSGPCTKLAQAIAALVEGPEVSRDHWGMAVTAMDGAPIYLLNEGQLFQPASNAKLYTTAAAMALLGSETTFETRIVARGVMEGATALRGDVVLVGAGDANLSGRAIPYVTPAVLPKVDKGAPPLPEVNPLRYLEAMAEQVAATGLKVVNGDVVGDDTLFPWEPYPQDWSIDDTVWGYGAPVSALTMNDNQIKVTVTPAAIAGQPATVVVDPAVPSYYTLDVSVTTGENKSGSHVQMERALGSKVLRVYGSIAVDAQPDEEEVAIYDPAEYAAVALKGMLEKRGIVVTGRARAEHRVSLNEKGFVERMKEPGQESAMVTGGIEGGSCLMAPPSMPGTEVKVLSSRSSPSLADDVTVTNKVSQNLHAELWLHHLGKRAFCGDGSTVAGARVVRAFV
jgi:D-alanyl-D-alanine carboxypeptidase/D-alanyl-D-alanine-endopeptidase (penicillin-binding protein 4)